MFAVTRNTTHEIDDVFFDRFSRQTQQKRSNNNNLGRLRPLVVVAGNVNLICSTAASAEPESNANRPFTIIVIIVVGELLFSRFGLSAVSNDRLIKIA